MRAVILEDDPSDVQKLLQYFDRYTQERGQDVQTFCYNSPISFLTDYRSQYDLLVLDIQMPDMTGMQVAEKIRLVDEQAMIVFITSLAQYAIAGYRVRALDYILKPVSYFDFTYMMDKAFTQLQSRAQKSVVVNSKLGTTRIPVSSILYAEVQNHRLSIHTSKESVEAWCSLSALEEQLPDGMFARINAGITVNLNAVLSVVNDAVLLPGVSLPLSRRRKKDFCENLARYFGGIGHE